jgi:hypothetical protein
VVVVPGQIAPVNIASISKSPPHLSKSPQHLKKKLLLLVITIGFDNGILISNN